MERTHHYDVSLAWTGNTGNGTRSCGGYSRDHDVEAPARWNPEELLVASLSQCHMLWYLSLCAGSGSGRQ